MFNSIQSPSSLPSPDENIDGLLETNAEPSPESFFAKSLRGVVYQTLVDLNKYLQLSGKRQAIDLSNTDRFPLNIAHQLVHPLSEIIQVTLELEGPQQALPVEGFGDIETPAGNV